jgi:hypothetical protein
MVALDLLAEVRGPPNLLDEHDHCLEEVLRVFDPDLAALDCLTGLVRGSDPAFARALADVAIGRAEKKQRSNLYDGGGPRCARLVPLSGPLHLDRDHAIGSLEQQVRRAAEAPLMVDQRVSGTLVSGRRLLLPRG